MRSLCTCLRLAATTAIAAATAAAAIVATVTATTAATEATAAAAAEKDKDDDDPRATSVTTHEERLLSFTLYLMAGEEKCYGFLKKPKTRDTESIREINRNISR